MNNTNQPSLAKRLTVSTIALIAGTLIIVTGIVYLTIVSFGNKFLDNELQEKSNFIQKAFAVPIWTYDQYQINEIGNSLLGDAKYTYVSALKVETTTNETLFEKTQDKKSDYFRTASLPFTKTRVIDIYKDDRKIGMISVAMTNYGYIKAFRDQFIIIIIAMTILMIIISKLASYYINKTLTVPLTKILTHVHHIEEENYTQHELANLPRELDSISRALNQAASVIEKRNKDIMFYTNDLEKLVQHRTAELEEQMMKNLNTARLAAVGEMAADVAHEINNPLTVIDLHAAKLKRLQSGLPEDVSHSIDKVQQMVKRIGKIIKGLKSLSRDGHADPLVAFSISSMIEDVKMLVEMKVRSHDIRFDVVIPDPGLQAIGREVQISQVLVNIIGNAVDAVTGLPDKWIRVEVKEKDDKVYFYITDCGKGIPPDLQEKIMHPFFTTKGVNKGTGLGLSISKNIIEEHDGHLEYNKESPNTQFVFTLKKA
ncbi:ATP-binding protein [Bacteriovorax sp. PP10]|uniref:histidine kinase n=1 Tax=Bacteriovorax antarcticus TaxID=3088717 RepID=A0ABU5W2S9_9BACT|nr:ATP-binding protein [Bacteriovorax sp. PP10]MEA9358110.1 ATP-binding protein [Bacteriovorax sp. PP10]